MHVDKKIGESDGSLINAIAQGDEKAFGLIFERYSRKIYGLARKSGFDHADSEGIVQDVFIIVWQRRHFLDPELSFNAYLFKISKSVIIRKRKRILLELAYQKATTYTTANQTESSVEDKVIFEDLLVVAHKLIEKLPKNQKRAFILKNFNNFSVQEIADILHVPKRKVENQLSRANKTLKEKLASKKWGIISVFIFIINTIVC